MDLLGSFQIVVFGYLKIRPSCEVFNSFCIGKLEKRTRVAESRVNKKKKDC